MEYDDWKQEISLDTFEEDPEVKRWVRDEEEGVGEGEADEIVELEPRDALVADDILPSEPSILDKLVKDPVDPSSP